MKTAVSLCGQEIAGSLGKTNEFLLFSEDSEERVVCLEKIPLFLKKNGVEVLICNGIGNCMMELLKTMKIEVIPGVAGDVQQVKESFLAGTLVPGEKYSCTDHGESCGACAGTF